jgi:hypothetical protein
MPDLRQTQWGPGSPGAATQATLQTDDCAFATAAEQMFFLGAPLAHVVAYCEHLRMANISRRNMELSRRIARQRPSASRSIFSGWDETSQSLA